MTPAHDIWQNRLGFATVGKTKEADVGFLDKVKEAASDVATEAKKGTAQLKDKMDDAALKKKGDDFAKQLGYLIYKERRHDKPAGEEADRLIAELAEVEKTLEAAGTDAADPGDSSDKGEASEGPAPA